MLPPRNGPCPCGSGRKFKRCCIGRKPSYQSVIVDLGEQTRVTGVAVRPDGRIEILQDGKLLQPYRVWSSSYRERGVGREKQLTAVPALDRVPRIGEGHALLTYDRIFAIDTNTVYLQERRVSVACVAGALITAKGQLALVNAEVLGWFEFHGSAASPENVAWTILNEFIVASPDFRHDIRVGLVTDSDRGMHGAYNERTAAFIPDRILPPYLTLIYGSDSGRGVCNALLRLCDKSSREILKAIAADKLPPCPITPDVELFTHLRCIRAANISPSQYRLGAA